MAFGRGFVVGKQDIFDAVETKSTAPLCTNKTEQGQ
jgi:hypothetical protein